MVIDGVLRNGYLAVKRKFEGVREQIEDGLLPHVAINKDRFRQWRAIDGKTQSRPLYRLAECIREIGGEGGKVCRLIGGQDAACFDTREIKQGVDQLEQAQRVAAHDLQLCAMLFRQRMLMIGQNVVDWPQQQRERGAKLVADIAEKGGFCTIKLGQFFGLPASLLVGKR